MTPALVFYLVVLCSCGLSSSISDDDGGVALARCLANTTGDESGAVVGSILFSPSAPSFDQLLTSYIRNRRFMSPSASNKNSQPNSILTPRTPAHVSAAVRCAKSLGLQIRIRSGGHDYDGLSYQLLNSSSGGDRSFLLMDMFHFSNVTVDLPSSETAWVGAGATLGELYYRIWEKSKVHAFPAGLCPTVAVGGHLSGGGYGNLLRKHGLSVDQVVDAQMVDAEGRILDRKSMGEDVFWAIRGGGGASFGVILGYKVNVVRVPPVVSVFRVERWIIADHNGTDIFYKWQQIAYRMDSDLFIRVLVQPVTPPSSNIFSAQKKSSAKVVEKVANKKNSTKTIRLTFIAQFLGSADRLVSLMDNEFPELGLKKQDCKEMNWLQSMLFWNNFTSPQDLLDRNLAGSDIKFLKRKSDYVQQPIPKHSLELIWNKMIQLGKTGLVFNQYGGKMAEIPATATPFPHRAGNIFKIQYSVNWNEPGKEAEDEYLTQIRELYEFNAPFVSKNPRGTFVNYRDIDIGINNHRSSLESYAEGRVYGTKYFMQNFDRLVKAKTAVDPQNFFRYEQSIPTLPA